MKENNVNYSNYLFDHFEGIFDIPCDGARSDIEDFEDDLSDAAESLDSIPKEEDEDDLPRFPEYNNEDEDDDSDENNGDSAEEGRERGLLARLSGMMRGVSSIFLNFEKSSRPY